MSTVDDRARQRTSAPTTPLIACERHRCCARHDLRQGADPIAVAALLEICVEDLYDALNYIPRRDA